MRRRGGWSEDIYIILQRQVGFLGSREKPGAALFLLILLLFGLGWDLWFLAWFLGFWSGVLDW